MGMIPEAELRDYAAKEGCGERLVAWGKAVHEEEFFEKLSRALLDGLLRLNEVPPDDPIWSITNRRPTLMKLGIYFERLLAESPEDDAARWTLIAYNWDVVSASDFAAALLVPLLRRDPLNIRWLALAADRKNLLSGVNVDETLRATLAEAGAEVMDQVRVIAEGSDDSVLRRAAQFAIAVHEGKSIYQVRAQRWGALLHDPTPPRRVTPPDGLTVRQRPGDRSPFATLGPGEHVAVTERRGDWAHIDCTEGVSGWVDGRRLIERPGLMPPTHVTPPNGLSVWDSPDEGSQIFSLGSRQHVAVTERRGDWAHIVFTEGWWGSPAWVDGRRLVELPGPELPVPSTHVTPPDGLRMWQRPGDRSPFATLGPGEHVAVTERSGDWAHIVCTEGFSGWVDGWRLVELKD